MIKEVTNSFKAALYQRVSSPLYGTYIFSWIMYNWKIVLPLVFGSPGIDTRLLAFTYALSPSEGSIAYDSVFAPMIATAAILLLQPIIQRFIFIYTEWNKSEGLKKRDKFSNETMLTLEQSNELRASVHKIHAFHQETLENKEAEITSLNKMSDSKDKEIDRLNEQKTTMVEDALNFTRKLSERAKDLVAMKLEVEVSGVKYSRISDILRRQRLNSRVRKKSCEDSYQEKLRISTYELHSEYKEIIEDKDADLKEFKALNISTSKENHKLNKTNANKLTLIETLKKIIEQRAEERDTAKVELKEHQVKYTKLLKFFNDERQKNSKLREKYSVSKFYASKVFVRSMCILINMEKNYSSMSEEILGKLIGISDLSVWKESCNRLIVEGFLGSSSYQMADEYFDQYIRPNVKRFDSDLLELLLKGMQSNSQISDRFRAKGDLSLVKSVLAVSAV
jgi:hypothetical protein